MSEPGFCVLYRWVVKAGHEDRCRDAWARLTRAIRAERGGLGSRLHVADDGTWVAYAQWPSRQAWEAAQQQPSPDPEATAAMQAAIERRLPPIPLEPRVDLLDA